MNLKRLLRWTLVVPASVAGLGAGLFATVTAISFMESPSICPDQYVFTGSDQPLCLWPPAYRSVVMAIGLALTATLTVVLGSVTAPHPKRNVPYWIFAAGAAVAAFFFVPMLFGGFRSIAYVGLPALAAYVAGFATAFGLSRHYCSNSQLSGQNTVSADNSGKTVS